MNELIKITQNEKGENAVNARGLHEFLGIETPYNKWFSRMVEYGFVENQDFVAVGQKCPIANGGYQERTDHIITLDMAKELAMIQRTEKGKQARRYFIECEKQLKAQFRTPSNMIEALELAIEQQKQIEAQKLALDYQPVLLQAEFVAVLLDYILVRFSVKTDRNTARNFYF